MLKIILSYRKLRPAGATQRHKKKMVTYKPRADAFLVPSEVVWPS